MHPLRNGSQVTARPARKTTAGTPGYFSESNDNSQPSYPGQDWFNDVIDEFANALAASGLSYVPGDLTHLAKMIYKPVFPINDDWNGYMDPEHQSQLPSAAGYPKTTALGGTVYTQNQEISFGIFSGSTGNNTVSADSDGWVFSGRIYKLFDFTLKQLPDVNAVKVFIRDQSGNAFHLKNGDTGVSVSVVNSSIKVELNANIFTALGITKVWYFFCSLEYGYVPDLSPAALVERLMGSFIKNADWVNETGNRAVGADYKNTLPYPIEVAVRITSTTGGGGAALFVNGIAIDNFTNGTGSMEIVLHAEVAPGGVYKIDNLLGTSTLTAFREFK
ncbi:hypothetical protein RQV73_001711 [Vibrio fluvialis]|nr:hypothetical protein [Vibrio fluvialis]